MECFRRILFETFIVWLLLASREGMAAIASASMPKPRSDVAPARLDRGFLDAAIYPVVLNVSTRFADTDLLRHVNNVAAVGLLQEGRTAFDRASGLQMIGAELRTMVVGLNVEYAAELLYPGMVEVRTGLLAIGRSSFSLAQVALQHERPALYATATLVMTDANGPAPIPDFVRTAYERLRISDSRGPASADRTAKCLQGASLP